jgi:hypothetical protein
MLVMKKDIDRNADISCDTSDDDDNNNTKKKKKNSGKIFTIQQQGISQEVFLDSNMINY